MAQTDQAETQAKAKQEQEERDYRNRVLDELHLIRRALEKIADRVGGVGQS